MGLVSTLEDIVKRFESDMHMLRAEISKSPDNLTEGRLKTLTELVSRGESALQETYSLFNLGTDPDIKLAAELQQARNNNAYAVSRIQELQRTCLSLKEQLDRERSRAEDMQERYEACKKELHRAERQIEKAAATNPAGLYEAYSKGIGSKGRSGANRRPP